MLHYLRHRTVQTLIVISLYSLLAPYLSMNTHRFFYTSSLLIKDLLIWLMPITVAVYIATTIESFERKAPLFILILILFEATSNFLSVWYGYSCGMVLGTNSQPLNLVTMNQDFTALWRLPFAKPVWWSSDKGALFGLIIGCYIALRGNDSLHNVIYRARNIVEIILTKFFATLIPLFVLGFLAQIYVTGLLQQMLLHFSKLILDLIIILSCYLLFLYAISGRFKISTIKYHIQNMLPAGLIAFSSGCSLSTMPWTIEGAAKNLTNPSLAKAIIPATTNIQQVGDCITHSMLCFLIYQQFYGSAPDVITWLSFSLVFTIARFATTAMLGGAIFLMLPIYEIYLNFTPEMIAVSLALNVILDPIITSSNVLGNGALCSVFERVWSYVLSKIPTATRNKVALTH